MTRLIIDHAPNALIMVGRLGMIVMVNAEAERIFGYSRTELVGRPIEILVPDRFRTVHTEVRAGYFAEQHARPMGAGRDLYGLRKDGSEFPVEIGLNPIKADDEAMVLASVIDITERKAAELALRESEQRARSLAAIVESSHDAIIGVGLDGLVVSWNRAAERIFGFSEAEMIGQPVTRLAAPDLEAEMVSILDRIRRGERVEHYETARRHKDGSILRVSLTESPIYNADGKLIGASKVLRDITAEKATQAAFKDLQAELVHMSRFTALGEMASTLAHELNQPLTAVTSYLNGARRLLDSGKPDVISTARDALEQAAQQALRAGQIIRRLREFVSRGDSERQAENLPKLIEEASALTLFGAKETGVRVSFLFDPQAYYVLADRIQIQQVLLNLMRNAIEAMQEVTRRELTVSSRMIDERTVQVDVVDTGPGIAEEIRARLFEPFVTTKRHGMGVGLSISRTIAEAHGGKLWAESNPEGGTIFHLTLKRIAVEALDDAE
jgi:two-component system sensor kinase FixL